MDTFTPPATASSHPPLSRLWHAKCIAVSDEEHIVSIAMLGPWKLQKYDTRLAIDDGVPPTAMFLPRACSCAPYS